MEARACPSGCRFPASPHMLTAIRSPQGEHWHSREAGPAFAWPGARWLTAPDMDTDPAAESRWSGLAPGSCSAGGHLLQDARAVEAAWSCLRQAVGLHGAVGHDHPAEPCCPPDLYFGPGFRAAACEPPRAEANNDAPEGVRAPGRRPRAVRSAPVPPSPPAPAPASAAHQETPSKAHEASAHPRSSRAPPADNMEQVRNGGVSFTRRNASGTAGPHSAPAAQSFEDRLLGVSFIRRTSEPLDVGGRKLKVRWEMGTGGPDQGSAPRTT